MSVDYLQLSPLRNYKETLDTIIDTVRAVCSSGDLSFGLRAGRTARTGESQTDS